MGRIIIDSWGQILLSVGMQMILAILIGSVILGIYKVKYLRRSL